MPDVDPYVAPPAEPTPTPRLVQLRPLLIIAIVLLLVGAWVGSNLVADRQDPTLQVPDGETAPAQPADGPGPVAPDLPTD